MLGIVQAGWYVHTGLFFITGVNLFVCGKQEKSSQPKMEILNIAATEKTVIFMTLAVAISENSV